MFRYNSITCKNMIIDLFIKRTSNLVHIKTIFNYHPLDSNVKQSETIPYACCLPFLPQCPPAIPDCEPCPPSCPKGPPKSDSFMKNFLVQALKAIILGASIYWTYSEGVWSHPNITDRTFRRWYGQVFGSPTPEACICDDKKHIPTHEEISYRVTQTYYGLTAGTFKKLMSLLSKGNVDKKVQDCGETALCPKMYNE